MQTFTRSLLDLFMKRYISYEVAMRMATNKEDFARLIDQAQKARQAQKAG
jgi:Tfp pilus assembly ATPase PilU